MATIVLPPTTGAPPDVDIENYVDLNNPSSSTIPAEVVTVVDLASADYPPLDALADVTAPNPTDGDVIAFDTTSNTWISKSLGITSLVDVSSAAPVNGAALVYNSTTEMWGPAVISSESNITKLDDIPDVTAPSPANNDVLSFDAASQTWIAKPQAYAGAISLDNLSDVVATTPSNNDSLVYDQVSGSWIAKQQLYTSAIADGVMSSALGGASSTDAAVWKTKSIAQTLDTILFPDIAPTYTIPTITLSATVTGTREVGSPLNQSLSSVATENDAGIYTSITYRKNGSSVQVTGSPAGVDITGISAQFGYSDPNNPNKAYSTAYSENTQVVSGSTTWTVEGVYNAGLPKQNNKGVVDARASLIRSTNAPQAASTVTSSSVSVTGIYPFFWGKSSTPPTAATIAAAILAGTTNKVLTDASGTVTVTFNASSEYVWIAHLGSYTSKTKWYNTALNNGNIGPGNFILSPVSQNVSSPDGYWTGISYKIYISSGATDTNGSIEFRNI